MTTDTYKIEQYMRRHLDGNFWAVNLNGEIIHCKVPNDYTPTGKRFVAVDFEDTEDGETAMTYRMEWTDDHFKRIEEMRIRGWTWKKVSQKIGSTESSTASFYKRTIAQQDANMTPEIMKRRMKIVRYMYDAEVSPRFIKIYTCYTQAFVDSVVRTMR